MTSSALTHSGEASARPGERRLTLVLGALAVLLLATVLFYDFVLPQSPVRLARASAGLIGESAWWSWVAGLPWPQLTGAWLATALLGVGSVAFLVYGTAVVATWGRPARAGTLLAVVVPAALFCVLGALAMPTQSSDVVDYLLSGRVASEHGSSPYTTSPETFPDDPLLPFASGDYTADAEQKPPIWIGIAVGVSAVAGDQPATAVLVFRSFFALVSMLNLALIWLVLRRWRPNHVLAGLVTYGWSPVVTMHAQAKFDVVMALFALAAALALVLGHRYAMAGALWCSVLVKVLTLPLAAVPVLADLKARAWGRVALSGVVVAVVTLLLYAPVEGGVGLVVEHLLLADRSGAQLPAAASLLFALVVCAAVLWAGLAGRGDTEGVLQGWALVSLTLVLLVPPDWSWYLITPAAVVALSGDRWRTLVLYLLSGLLFAFDTWTRSRSARYPLPEPEQVSRSVFFVALVLVGAVSLAAAAFLRRRRGRRTSRRPATRAG